VVLSRGSTVAIVADSEGAVGRGGRPFSLFASAIFSVSLLLRYKTRTGLVHCMHLRQRNDGADTSSFPFLRSATDLYAFKKTKCAAAANGLKRQTPKVRSERTRLHAILTTNPRRPHAALVKSSDVGHLAVA